MAEPTPELKLFNTLTGQLEPFVPLDPAGKQVRMYVCGPTVYDDAHLGHARCYITWDVLYRFLKFLGYNVKYVRNVTDVDDKILNRAKERGEAPAELAERNYQRFTEDMEALNVLPPDEEPRATDYIPQILEGIQALIDNGAAYTTADGSAYFRVSAKADYGKLKFGTQNVEALKKHLNDLQSGARVEVDEEKESPLDFALWKAVPKDDPYAWESPWPAGGAGKGWGRPGWHMECSAMNHAVFGDQIDIHAGGADLIFPHHENEIAQSEAWSGLKGDGEHSRFAKYWLHNGFVNVSGEKMSKSLGNFSTIKKLLERYDANTIRHFLLTNNYQMPVDFSEEALEASSNWRFKIHRGIKIACDKLGVNLKELEKLVVDNFSEYKNYKLDDPYGYYLLEYKNRMANDLNSATALSLLSEGFKSINIDVGDHENMLIAHNRLKESGELKNNSHPKAPDDPVKAHLSNVITVFYHLGFKLDLIFPPLEMPVNEISTIYREMTGKWLEPDAEPEIMLKEMIEMRKQAKATKNWTQADAIRKHFTDIGLQILDNKDGTTTVEKDGLEIVRV